MSREAREPLKTVTSLLRPPNRVTKADFPIETLNGNDTKENNPEFANQLQSDSKGVKRKKSEAELRESLRQRKLNQTISIDKPMNTASNTSTAAKKAKTDLNQTLVNVTATKTLTRTKSASSLRNVSTVSQPAKDSQKKRPTWDIKGRLEDMEKLTELLKLEVHRNQTTVGDLQNQLQDRETQICTIKETKTSLQANIEVNQKELDALLRDKLDLQNKVLEIQQQHNAQMQDLLYKHRSLETMHQTTLSSLNMSKAENESHKLTIDNQRGQLSAQQAEMEGLKSALQSTESLALQRKRKIEELECKVDEQNRNIARLEAEMRENEQLRKKLHNTIQELKGNIRVFCRVRPLIGAEIAEFGTSPPLFEYPANSDHGIEISTSSLSGISGVKTDKKFSFAFDKVFSPNVSQAEVFREISQLVQSALDGYNTCIFAYGQTGSGKTYTMEGPGIESEIDMPIVDTEKRGMIPRAVEQIFSSADTLKDKGWEFEFEVMYLEIYNETLRDLLSPQNNLKDDVKYEIKHDAKGFTTVSCITTVKVRNPTQVYELLKRASKNRAVSKTNMNEHSSRSHSVFQMRLNGNNTITNEQIRSVLNLIDLAGSERLDRSGCTGQHMKETQNINRSLSSLGDVIASLANKEAHVPYRNSKLTFLLQNSLGGNSKTLMFVNVSPRPSDLNETISSLRFATKVNACEIGTAKSLKKVDLKNL